MSPPSREICGPRPSTLKIQKDSHQIQKKPSTTNNHHQPPRLPVIIYTHSPKIIHTQARDFMALVQRLTGLTRSTDARAHDNQKAEPPPPSTLPPMPAALSDGTDTADNDEKKTVETHDAEADGANVAPALAIELFDDQYMFPDMSLTPRGPSDFLCSPRSLYMGGSVSPSFTEAVPDF